ncbi:hypothetical protein EJB05_30023 [Eragrostis curvula]|uniref:Uncharacterized protein n=1 Tax=Eragrostis curvula TaxID=38414 RepID=A0A5J9UVL7_9POAL|nr:hypothetical protein EJB05_30023 [Eragrostis curvula]
MAKRRRGRPVIRLPAIRRPLLRRRARGNARRVLSAFVKLRRDFRLLARGGVGNRSNRRGGKPTAEVFDASHVERMLRSSGQLDDAFYYLQRFLYRVPRKESSQVSWQLLDQVSLFKTFATVAAGGKDGAELAALFQNPSEDTLKLPIAARLYKIITKLNADPIRASNIWQEIQPRRLGVIMDLVSRCPELQGDVRLPRKRILLWDPITHGLCKCPSRRKKISNHAPSDVLVREFLHTRLLTTQGENGSGVPSNASSSSLALDMQTEQNAPEPIILGEHPVENLERAAPQKQEVMQA